MMRIKCVKPNIKFKSPKPIEIYVPIPVGLTFEDGASYNDAELGFKGGITMSLANNLQGSGSAKDVLDGIMKTGTNLYNSAQTKDIVALAIKGAADFVGADAGVRSGAQIGMGTTLNKNVTTEFTGVGVRSFNFVFKFVSKSEEETLVIKNIIETFRSNLYPVGNFISLQYPPTWNIQFLNGVSGNDIPYLPKIFECYLKGLSSNFNPSANVWRKGGSPIETDVTVQFVESRALTYEDIKSLEARAFQEGDFQRLYGGGTETGIRDIIGSSATGSALPPQTEIRDAEGKPIVILQGPGALQTEGPAVGPGLGVDPNAYNLTGRFK
jgi:hypothetical protein